MFETLIYYWMPRLAHRWWGDTENPSWLQGLTLWPEFVTGRREVGLTLLLWVRDKIAERPWLHWLPCPYIFGDWLDEQFNIVTDGVWGEILDELSGGEK